LAVRNPWLVSLAAHAVAAAAALTLLRLPDPPATVRMHLAAAGSSQSTRTAIAMPGSPASQPAAPSLPGWKEHTASPGGQGVPTVPVSLDELLGPQAETVPSVPTSGWVSEGYSPPPLPPPGLAPPQGAGWSLIISVPAGGGPGAAEGLDSGHPELDRWLEEYLRTVSFPAGLDGQPYQLHWNLRLVSDRPR
jgi:hypothetical protein